jgi:hypothetical protein
MLISMYIPHWERAVGPLLLQLLLISILWAAMFAYSRRWGRGLAELVLSLGVLIPTVAVLATQVSHGLGEHGDACRAMAGHNYSDAFLIVVQFFELWQFAIFAFVGLIIALFVIPFASELCQRDETDDGDSEDAVSSR